MPMPPRRPLSIAPNLGGMPPPGPGPLPGPGSNPGITPVTPPGMGPAPAMTPQWNIQSQQAPPGVDPDAWRFGDIRQRQLLLEQLMNPLVNPRPTGYDPRRRRRPGDFGPSASAGYSSGYGGGGGGGYGDGSDLLP